MEPRDAAGMEPGDAAAMQDEEGQSLSPEDTRRLAASMARLKVSAGLREALEESAAAAGRVEEALEGFACSLNGISRGMLYVQDKSVSVGLKLKRRKRAGRALTAILAKVAVPPGLAAKVSDKAQSHYLSEVVAQLDEMRALMTAPENADLLLTRAWAEGVAPTAASMQGVTVHTVRDLLLRAVNMVRDPKVCVHELQASVLLAYRPMVRFLAGQHDGAFRELQLHYAHTLSTLYANKFKALFSGFEPALGGVEPAGRGSMSTIGVPASAQVDAPSGDGRPVPSRVSDFFIGPKVLLLLSDHSVGVSATLSQPNLSVEQMYISSHQVLMDTVTSEYLFISLFFGMNHRTTLLFCRRIFAAALAVFRDAFSDAVSGLDAFSLLCIIQLNHGCQIAMNRRRNPCLDTYLDNMNMVLWPKFKSVFEAHVASLAPDTLGCGPVARMSTLSRYAAFSASVHCIQLLVDQSPINIYKEMTRLRLAVHLAIKNWAGLASSELDALVNSISLVHTVVGAMQTNLGELEVLCTSKDGAKVKAGWVAQNEDFAYFEEKLDRLSAQYSEVVLRRNFASLLKFVAHCEGQDSSMEDRQTTELNDILAHFSSNWEPFVFSVRIECAQLFEKSEAGPHVFEEIMSLMITYYLRLLEICTRMQFQKTGELAISMSTIMSTIKRAGEQF